MNRLQRTKNRKKNKVRYVVIVICLGVFCYSAFRVGSSYYRAFLSQRAAEEEARKIEQQLEEQRQREEEEARRREEEEQRQAEADQEDKDKDKDKQDAQPAPFVLNFDELLAVNSDIIGWLKVDGTNINYPVLYSDTDREFYLYHNYKREYDTQGSVYIENFNSKDLSDFNTIFYGHSMLNGNMFGTLHNFSNWNFFTSYGNIVFYTPGATYHYQVFETATIEDKHILTYLNNADQDSIKAYIKTISNYNGFKKTEYTITPDSHIITLSTCTTDDSKRLVVFAVLTSVT